MKHFWWQQWPWLLAMCLFAIALDVYPHPATFWAWRRMAAWLMVGIGLQCYELYLRRKTREESH